MAHKRQQLGLGLVRRLRKLAGLTLCLHGINQALDLRKQIVGPKILRTHDCWPTLGFPCMLTETT